MLHCVKTEWDRCAYAYFSSVGKAKAVEGGRGDVQPEPITGVSFMDWPPFTGCWHACYIKETPPTAAPDNFSTDTAGAPVPLVNFASLARGTFLSWSCVEIRAFILHAFSIKCMSWHSRLLPVGSVLLEEGFFFCLDASLVYIGDLLRLSFSVCT